MSSPERQARLRKANEKFRAADVPILANPMVPSRAAAGEAEEEDAAEEQEWFSLLVSVEFRLLVAVAPF